MSVAPISAITATSAMARQIREMRAEEEDMTGYRPEDLDGWEFKILRAQTARFRRPERLQAVLQEEAAAGWELVEKFDDNRLRLKRRVECRERDSSLGPDPYRTWVGMTPGKVAWIVIAVSLLFMVLVIAVALIAAK